MSVQIDDLDRKILHYTSSGIHSYTDLAKLCNVGRNTIYRRMASLEDKGLISRRIMAIPNFQKLNISAIVFGLDCAHIDIKKVTEFLKKKSEVKLLWTTYGTHCMTFVVFCNQGEEGLTIQNLRESLAMLGCRIERLDTSVGFVWEKVDLSPF